LAQVAQVQLVAVLKAQLVATAFLFRLLKAAAVVGQTQTATVLAVVAVAVREQLQAQALQVARQVQQVQQHKVMQAVIPLRLPLTKKVAAVVAARALLVLQALAPLHQTQVAMVAQA
jgi:hypothetical protein